MRQFRSFAYHVIFEALRTFSLAVAYAVSSCSLGGQTGLNGVVL